MYLLHLIFELRRLLRSSFVWVLLPCLVFFFGFSLYTTNQSLARKAASVDDVLTAQREAFVVQKSQADSIRRGLTTVAGWWEDLTNPITVGTSSTGARIVAAEPQARNSLAVGLSDMTPDAWLINTSGKSPKSDAEFENPANLSYGTFDLAFVIAFLLPLLVIALCFDLISAEREQGTLPLLRAQPISGSRLFFSRAMARFTLLFAFALVALAPLLIWSGISPVSSVGVGVILVVTLSLLLWFLVALGINLLGGSSALNALRCIGAWLLLALILPILVNLVAEQVRPIPSRSAYINTERSIENALKESRPDRMAAFYLDNPRLKKKENNYPAYYTEQFALMDEERAIRDSILAPFEEQIASQSRFNRRLTWLSPTLSVYGQLTSLAATDRRSLDALEEAAETLHRRWSDWFTELFWQDEGVSEGDYARIEAFPDTVSTAGVQPSYRGLGWLLLQCLIAGGWCYWVARNRYLV